MVLSSRAFGLANPPPPLQPIINAIINPTDNTRIDVTITPCARRSGVVFGVLLMAQCQVRTPLSQAQTSPSASRSKNTAMVTKAPIERPV